MTPVLAQRKSEKPLLVAGVCGVELGLTPLFLCFLPLPSILSVQASAPAPHSLNPTHAPGDLVRGLHVPVEGLRVQILSLLLPHCVPVGKTLTLSDPQFCHLLKGYNALTLWAVLRFQ